MYSEEMTKPMREELTNVGITELKTPEDVDAALTKEGTTLILINSVCGCAAGSARPGVIKALQHQNTPKNKYTVFAGADTEATEKARSYLTDHPSSSPSIALLKDKETIFMMQRQDIEGKEAQAVAEELIKAFDRYCR